LPSATPRAAAPSGALRRLSARALELLFPARCAACKAPLEGAPNPWFCQPCWTGLPLYGAGVCDHCGHPIEADDLPAGWRCGACLKTAPPFARARSLGPYRGTLAEAVRLLKYGDRPGLARALVGRIDLGSAPPDLWDVDIVLPVPLHGRRLRERGYNQSARLALALARCLGHAAPEGVLERTRATRPQVGLKRAERAVNVRGAFRVARGARVAGRRVLLVDDVITTGATIGACARALMAARAARVTVWAAARQDGWIEPPGGGGAGVVGGGVPRRQEGLQHV
jgi:ComF family protein